MLQFVLVNLLMISFGVVVYLFIHVAVRMGESPRRPGYLARLVTSDIPEKLDHSLTALSTKTLRRLRVFIMKLDNAISFRLKAYKEKETPKSLKYDFGALSEEVKPEETKIVE